MPSWNDLVREFESKPLADQATWLQDSLFLRLREVSNITGKQVIFYTSAFLQKPQVPAQNLQIMHEDINGFMSVIYGMDCTKGLTLLLHTPGGVINAAETIVAYLRSKFTDIEVIIPTIAMSAGTMITLASNHIIMGRQSQLGPIDPQVFSGHSVNSARAIVDQFERAKEEIGLNVQLAHAWAPILQTIGPALLQQSQNEIDYGENMVKKWLETGMFAKDPNGKDMASETAKFFNAAVLHKSHGRRIDRDEARNQNLNITDLESNQNLQENVLTAYHLMTILFEKSLTSKFIAGHHGTIWLRNHA